LSVLSFKKQTAEIKACNYVGRVMMQTKHGFPGESWIGKATTNTFSSRTTQIVTTGKGRREEPETSMSRKGGGDQEAKDRPTRTKMTRA
jgi:hypothetical protein